MRPSAVLMVVLCVCLSEAKKSNSSKQFKDCREERLRTREEQFDVVFTGTVHKVDRVTSSVSGHWSHLESSTSSEYGAEIQIKRVIKGEEYDFLGPKKIVRIEGFGTDQICDNQVRVRDTRIFLLSVHHRNQLRLNGTLLRITVPNLERVTAVVKGEPYKRSVIVDVPCERKYCAFNAECIEQAGRAVCQCETNCPIGYQPVCGSNGATYPNECRLRVESCQKKVKVFVRHEGVCTGSRLR